MSDQNHSTADDNHTLNEQDKQSVIEGGDIRPTQSRRKGPITPAEERSALTNDDAGTVNAVQVNMDRSGAENIEAQRVTLDHSGAKSLKAQTANLAYSGAMKVSAETAEFDHSSAVLASARNMSLKQSKVVFAQSGETRFDGGGRVGSLITGKVEATGDINSGLMISGGVKAGGDVNVTFTAASAAALGAGFAVMLFVLKRLFKR